MVLVTLAQAKKFYGFPQRYVPTSRRYMRFLASDNDIDALVAAGFAVRLPDNNGFSWTAAAMTVYNNSSWMDDPPAVRDSQVFANATSIKQEANAGPANTVSDICGRQRTHADSNSRTRTRHSSSWAVALLQMRRVRRLDLVRPGAADTTIDVTKRTVGAVVEKKRTVSANFKKKRTTSAVCANFKKIASAVLNKKSAF